MAAADTDHAIDRRVLRRVWIIAGVFLVAVAVINALTLMTEAERAGRSYDLREPWLLEGTSVLALFALVPLAGLWERRFAFAPETWHRALAAHAAGSLVFSLLHVLGMWLLRSLVWPPVFGSSYSFFDDVPTDLLYEYRKDLLPYAVIILLLTLLRGIEESRREAEEARREARATGRLTLRSGGRLLFLDAGSLDWASAAGNYVEIRANGATHLVRISLSALEQQLAAAGVAIARVHRSRLVNRSKVREITPTADGDFRVRLVDGTELRGSRRFRSVFA